MAVLIVEDDQALRETLTGLLADAEYSAIPAADGLEALQYLEREASSVQLILLDLMMPRMDGKTFLLERRSRPALAAIPVLVLSAYPGFGAMAPAAGVCGSLQKPCDAAMLIAEVRRLYRGQAVSVGNSSGHDGLHRGH